MDVLPTAYFVGDRLGVFVTAFEQPGPLGLGQQIRIGEKASDQKSYGKEETSHNGP